MLVMIKATRPVTGVGCGRIPMNPLLSYEFGSGYLARKYRGCQEWEGTKENRGVVNKNLLIFSGIHDKRLGLQQASTLQFESVTGNCRSFLYEMDPFFKRFLW